MTFRVPLSALLSQVLTAFTREFELGMAEAGHPELSLALGSNILRFLDTENPLRAGEIAALAGVSKQAISQQVRYLESQGHVAIAPHSQDRRANAVTLTERGAQARDSCRPLFGDIETRWAQAYGAEAVGHLRVTLEELVAQLDDGLPHFPA